MNTGSESWMTCSLIHNIFIILFTTIPTYFPTFLYLKIYEKHLQKLPSRISLLVKICLKVWSFRTSWILGPTKIPSLILALLCWGNFPLRNFPSPFWFITLTKFSMKPSLMSQRDTTNFASINKWSIYDIFHSRV